MAPLIKNLKIGAIFKKKIEPNLKCKKKGAISKIAQFSFFLRWKLSNFSKKVRNF